MCVVRLAGYRHARLAYAGLTHGGLGLVTISALATATGTLILAAATFASVRSANRAARVAEQAFLMGQRPLVMQSRLDDPA